MPAAARLVPRSIAWVLAWLAPATVLGDVSEATSGAYSGRGATGSGAWQSAAHPGPGPQMQPRTRQVTLNRSPRSSGDANTDGPNQPAVAARPGTANGITGSPETGRSDHAPVRTDRYPRFTSVGSKRRRNTAKPTTPSTGAAMMTVGSSLCIVLGLFLACIWFARRGTRGNVMPLPNGVVEVLGRSSLAGRQQLYLVRLGNKLLLLCATPAGMETLSEITDHTEIDRIVGLCRQNQPGSISASFRQVMSQLSHTSGVESLPPSAGRRTPRAAAHR